MATITKPPKTEIEKRPENDPVNQDQTRKDRITAVVMLIVMLLVFALIMWLASIGEGPPPEDFDHWMTPF